MAFSFMCCGDCEMKNFSLIPLYLFDLNTCDEVTYLRKAVDVVSRFILDTRTRVLNGELIPLI